MLHLPEFLGKKSIPTADPVENHRFTSLFNLTVALLWLKFPKL